MPNGSDVQSRMIGQSEEMVDTWFGALRQLLDAYRDMTKMALTAWLSAVPYSPVAEALTALDETRRSSTSPPAAR